MASIGSSAFSTTPSIVCGDRVGEVRRDLVEVDLELGARRRRRRVVVELAGDVAVGDRQLRAGRRRRAGALDREELGLRLRSSCRRCSRASGTRARGSCRRSPRTPCAQSVVLPSPVGQGDRPAGGELHRAPVAGVVADGRSTCRSPPAVCLDLRWRRPTQAPGGGRRRRALVGRSDDVVAAGDERRSAGHGRRRGPVRPSGACVAVDPRITGPRRTSGRIADSLPVTSQYLAGASVPPSTAWIVLVCAVERHVREVGEALTAGACARSSTCRR